MKRGNQRKVKYVASITPPISGDEDELRTFFHTPSSHERGRGNSRVHDVKEAPDSDDMNHFILKYDGMKERVCVSLWPLIIRVILFCRSKGMLSIDAHYPFGHLGKGTIWGAPREKGYG